MKKLELAKFGIVILIGILLSIVITLAIVFPWVYHMNQNKGFETILAECPYNVGEYQENHFDCSNMAAMLDAWLEHNGYESWILIFSKADRSPGHCLVLADGKLIEPTTKTIRWGLTGGPSVRGEGFIYFPPNLADETYSSLVQIIDSPSQLGNLNFDEWTYPQRW